MTNWIDATIHTENPTLPRAYNDVLVTDGQDIRVGYLEKTHTGYMWVETSEDRDVADLIYVTHWMLLPELP